MRARDTRVVEKEIRRRSTTDRQRAVERYAFTASEHQIEVHRAVARGPARAASGIRPPHLAVADCA